MFCYSEPRKNLKETTLFLVFHLLSFLVVNCSQILQENSVAIRKMELLRLEIISAISLRSFGEVVKNNNSKKCKPEFLLFHGNFWLAERPHGPVWKKSWNVQICAWSNLGQWCCCAPCEGFAEPRALLLPAGKTLGVWTFERVPRSLHVENQNNLLAKRSNPRHKKDNPTPTSSQTCSQWSPVPWPISGHQEVAWL